MPLARLFGLGRNAQGAHPPQGQHREETRQGRSAALSGPAGRTGRTGWVGGEQEQGLPEADVPLAGALGCADALVSLRRALRSAQKTALVLALTNILCLAALCITLMNRPDPVYFGMSQEMKLLPMTPLSAPIMNEARLKNWVAQAVTLSFNLDYVHWKRQLNEVRRFFTRQAFVRFATSLDKEGHLDLIRQQRALMHAVVQGTPVMTRSGVVQGTLLWEFELPLLVTYETSAGRISNNAVTVVCQVQRVPATDYPQGVALTSLVTTRRVVVP